MLSRETYINNFQYISFQNDVAKLKGLQKEFFSSVGQQNTLSDYLERSYNVINDRLSYLKTSSNDREIWKQGVQWNLITALKERFRVTVSRVTTYIRDDEIFANAQKKEIEEPWMSFLVRGMIAYAAFGSEEQKREGFEGELGGYLAVRNFFLDKDTPIGSKAIIYSPPGKNEGTKYPFHFVDVYELHHGKQGKEIVFEWHAVSYNEELYKKKALEFNPQYFDGWDGQDLDAWYLSHPFFPTQEVLLQEMVGEIYGDTTPQEFEEIFGNGDMITFPFSYYVDAYIKAITAQDFSPVSSMKKFNALLNKADDLIESYRNRIPSVENNLLTQSAFYLEQELKYFELQPVEEKNGWGCPTSKGYTLGSMDAAAAFSAVSSPWSSDESEDINLCRCRGNEPHFHCPGNKGACRRVIVVGKGISRCPSCGQGKIC